MGAKRTHPLGYLEVGIYKLTQELNSLHSTLKMTSYRLWVLFRDPQCLARIFDIFAVDTVYHAAAYKHVPLMEQNVVKCITNNVFGTLNLAEYAIKAGVNHFILISTDKAVNPTNFMGASEAIGRTNLQIDNRKSNNDQICDRKV